MQIVEIPRIDRQRVAAMVRGPKCNLLDALKTDPEYTGSLTMLFFRSMAAHAERQFGEPCALFLAVCTIRHHRPGTSDHHAPAHTDAGFFKPHGRGLTFWCPLDTVGPGVPGVTCRVDGVETTPRLGPGQALVIPPDVEHRTQPIDGERISVEFRCTPRSQVPGNVAMSRIAVRDGRNVVVDDAPSLAARVLCAILPWEHSAHRTTA